MAKGPVTAKQDAAFQRRVNMPWIWQMQAHVLIGAANVLWKRYKVLSVLVGRRRRRRLFAGELQPWPAMMLDGFAIENLLKGLLLAQSIQATRGGQLERKFRTHDLTALCARAHIALNQREEELLERVKRMMELGRYPVGASAEMSWAVRLESPRDLNTIMALLQRIDDEFKQVAGAAVDEDIHRLGVRLMPIGAEEHLRRIALLHGERLDGSTISRGVSSGDRTQCLTRTT